MLVGIRLFELATDFEIFTPILFPEKSVEWKDRVQAVLLLLGLPVAYLLWHWRDTNVREQIENQRKDINLKEFNEVQLRASGALDLDLLAEAREQLQIAALQQLRGFLRGEYGESFRRPAFELLLVGHAAAMERIGHLKKVDELRAALQDSTNRIVAISAVIDAARHQLTRVERERLAIFRDEARWIFGSGFSLNNRRYDWLEIPMQAAIELRAFSNCVFLGAQLVDMVLESADLSGARLECVDLSRAELGGANLTDAWLEGATLRDACLNGATLCGARLSHVDFCGARLEGADLSGAWLEKANMERVQLRGANLTNALLDGANLHGALLPGANLTQASLKDVNLVDAQLKGADLFSAQLDAVQLDGASLQGTRLGLACLEGASLVGVKLEGADLRGTRFEGADLTWARLENADLARARFDAATALCDNWANISEHERETHRQAFVDRGAFRSDL